MAVVVLADDEFCLGVDTEGQVAEDHLHRRLSPSLEEKFGFEPVDTETVGQVTRKVDAQFAATVAAESLSVGVVEDSTYVDVDFMRGCRLRLE